MKVLKKLLTKEEVTKELKELILLRKGESFSFPDNCKSLKLTIDGDIMDFLWTPKIAIPITGPITYKNSSLYHFKELSTIKGYLIYKQVPIIDGILRFVEFEDIDMDDDVKNKMEDFK